MRLVDEAPRGRRLATISAMVVVGLVAVFQTAAIFFSMGAYRDAAHIIDISGSQRARSQQLAYFAQALHDDPSDREARAGIDQTIAQILATRAEIMREPKYIVGGRDRDGRNSLLREADGYIAEVRALERDPSNDAALEAVRRERPRIVAAYDRAVKLRVAIAQGENTRIMEALLAGLLIQIASSVGGWFAIVAPSERRALRLLSGVRQARKELEATFDGNPDGISVYDATGRMIRANATRAAFSGKKAEELVGKMFSEMVDPTYVDVSLDAMERTLRGEIVRFDSAIIAADGSVVDLAVAFHPRLVDSEVVGFNVVSKDIRKLRAAEKVNLEQTKRLEDLYEIASAHGRTTEDLLHSAIALVTARLGYQYGVVTEISDDVVSIAATSGNPRGIAVGNTHRLRHSLAQLALMESGAYEARDFRATPYAALATCDPDWRSVAGMKILAGGVVYGTIGFASDQIRGSDLTPSDIGFMRLACALLGTIIERGRQLRRLDTLAFSDALTGLPNRARFMSALETSIASDVPFALHYVDLDRFKDINDRFGHGTGDAVLKIAAERLSSCTRVNDVVARLGGDEFAIVQAGPLSRDSARLVACRIVESLAQPIVVDGVEHRIGASVGIALYPPDGMDARTLRDAADSALYRAKATGRSRYAFAVYSTPMANVS